MSELDLRGRLTLTVPEAGELLGIGRDAAYDAAASGELDCLQVGRRKVVPTHALLRKVGWPDDLIARALGVDLDEAPEHTEAGSSREPATATIYAFGQKNGDQSHGAPTPH